MNPPLKIKQWHPPEPKRKSKPSTTTENREPRRVLSSTPTQSTLCDAIGSPPTAGWDDFTDVIPYEESRSIKDIIDEAMHYSTIGNARGSISVLNPLPNAQVSPPGTACQAISSTFRLNDEGAYSADAESICQEITTMATETQPRYPMIEGSPRWTLTSMTIPEFATNPHPDLSLSGGMPTAFQSSCHTDFASQAPPSPSILEDEENVLSPDSISTPYESIWTPGADYATEYSVDTVQTVTSVWSGASPPLVQSCISSVTGTKLHSICHADSLYDQASGFQSPASTPSDTHEPDIVDILPGLRGPTCASSASYVAHPDIDEIVRQACITPGGDTPTSSADSTPAHALWSPSPTTSVETQRHSYDAPFHTSNSVPRDAPQQHPSETAQDREVKAATYDTKVEDATSPPSPRSQDAAYPPLGPAGRRRSRRTAAQKVAYYDDGSSTDTDMGCVDSQDDDECSLTAGAERGEGEVSDEDEQPPRKRRKPSMPSEALRFKRSHRAESLSTSIKRSMKCGEHVRITGVASPASSQATIPEAELGAMLTKCGEWPLENASLKYTIDSDTPVFQLQFNVPPRLLYDYTSRIAGNQTKSPSLRAVSKARRAPSARLRYTPSEDDLLLKLKSRDKLPWPEIHQRFCEVFPARPIESLQVHYSTKVKAREKC